MKEAKIFRFWFTGVLFIAGIGIIYLALTPIIMVLTAAFLAILLNRPTDFLTKYLKYKSLALLTVFIILISVVILLFITVIPFLAGGITVFTSTLPSTLQQLKGSTEPFYNFITAHGLESTFLQTADALKEQISNFAIEFLSGFGAAAISLINAFLILVMVAFFILEGPAWMERYFKWVYVDEKRRQYHRKIAQRLYYGITGYITASFIVACIMTALAVLGFLIVSYFMPISLSLVWPIGLIVFVTSFIPMFGGLVGGIITFILIGLYNPVVALIYIVYLFISRL
jgi:predicted PurR-regulated permease PerM